MRFSKSCDSDCGLTSVTPEQQASAKKWLIAIFTSKFILVLSLVICGLVAWRRPDILTSKIIIVWLLSTLISGWLFETVCIEMLMRIKPLGDTRHRRNLLERLGIVAAFGAFLLFLYVIFVAHVTQPLKARYVGTYRGSSCLP